MHLCFEPVSHPNGGLGVHVVRNSEKLEKYVDQFILNVPTGQDRPMSVARIGESRYSATISLQSNHLAKDPGIELLNDQEIFFDAYSSLCPRAPSIVHCHDAYLYPLAKKIRALFGSKIVVTSHLLMMDVLSIYEHIKTKNKYQIEVELEAYNQADAVITISEHYKKFLTDKLMVPEEKITLVYNGLDRVDHWARVREKPEVIGFLGRCAEMKGVSHLMALISRMPEQRFKVITAVKGDCMDPFAVDSFSWLSRQKNVEMVNGVHPDKKWPHVLQCDLAVMPSIREPWGIVATEWMQVGVPLIASNTGGLAEIATPERAWQCDPRKLVEAVKNYRYDESKIRRAKEFTSTLSWDRCAAETWEVYKRCLHSA